jgi:hypothetical protein
MANSMNRSLLEEIQARTKPRHRTLLEENQAMTQAI